MVKIRYIFTAHSGMAPATPARSASTEEVRLVETALLGETLHAHYRAQLTFRGTHHCFSQILVSLVYNVWQN